MHPNALLGGFFINRLCLYCTRRCANSYGDFFTLKGDVLNNIGSGEMEGQDVVQSPPNAGIFAEMC